MASKAVALDQQTESVTTGDLPPVPEEQKRVGRIDAKQGAIIHVYDGIEEADNALPLWWLWTFYSAIAFGVVYWFGAQVFFLLPMPAREYAEALEARASQGEVSEELLVAMGANPEATSEGRILFEAHCVVCHEAAGQGKIGPNLTDDAWLHGGAPLSIHESISAGRLQNGMPAWGQTLGPRAVQRLTGFVLSIRDTNVAGKAPEGEPWTRE